MPRPNFMDCCSSLDPQHSTQNHRVFSESRRLRRFFPSAGTDHASDANFFGPRIHPAEVLLDNFRKRACGRDNSGCGYDFDHLRQVYPRLSLFGSDGNLNQRFAIGGSQHRRYLLAVLVPGAHGQILRFGCLRCLAQLIIKEGHDLSR